MSRKVGCLGALAIPFTTIAVATRLLVVPTRTQLQPGGPYRTAAPAPVEGARRPLTPGATRFVGAMLLSCTLFPALAVVVRAIVLFRDSTAALILTIPFAWVVLFVGQIVGTKLFIWLEPRLPHAGG